MKLIQGYIENFGKISKKEISFKGGLNCFKEDNGSGKTTMAAFIKAMLYGMSDTKKTSLDENDRKHYLPWQGGSCGGSLTFESGGKIYRIERTFAQKASDDTLTVYDTATGRPTNVFSDGVGETLFGINADGFERTVFLSERALSPKSDNRSISAKLSDLVGCDGDIGGMDDAMKILEQRRKFYHKKGGSGELADVKAQIDEITRKLDGLGEVEQAIESARKKISALAAEIEAARSDEKVMMGQREEASIRAAENNYAKQFNDMKQSLELTMKKRSAILEMFGTDIPSFTDIDEARYKMTEAERLMDDVEGNRQAEEFAKLASKFDGKIDRAAIDNARAAVARVKARRAKENDPKVIRARKIFKGRIPTVEEIDRIEKLAQTKVKSLTVGAIVGYLLSLAIIVCGIIFMPVVSIFGAIGIVTTAIASAMVTGKKRSSIAKEIADFFQSVSGATVDGSDEIMARLNDMRSLVGVIDTTAAEDTACDDILRETVALFPDTRCIDDLDGCEKIIAEYEKYAELAVAERYIMGDRAARAERAQNLRREAMDFVARFHTRTTSPFSELRDGLTEYNRLTSEIVAKRDEIERLQNLYTVGEGNQQKARADVEMIDRKRRDNDEKIASLSRESALTERMYHSYVEELEMRDELSMRRAELMEILAQHQDNYDTILLTKKYITIAKDNMTVRYLGKTKAGFTHYAELIGEAMGDSFEMDTDFGITKQDCGATRMPEAYSKGTRDLFNLATRLGLIDALYEKEKPFLILDDPFTAFDDKKTDRALKLLRELAKDRQIIYFTCSKSRTV